MNSRPTRYGTCGSIIDRPPCDDRAIYYATRFGLERFLGHGRRARHWNSSLLDQLDACKCDCARRLILGVSRRETA